jgi:hypothetical protein
MFITFKTCSEVSAWVDVDQIVCVLKEEVRGTSIVKYTVFMADGMRLETNVDVPAILAKHKLIK